MNKSVIPCLLGLMSLCFVVMAHADQTTGLDFWANHAQGWHWYQDPTQIDSRSIPNTPLEPEAQMEVLQKEVKRTLDKAILNPTPANMQAYITLQNQVSEQAHQFALAWQAALLNNPTLDYSLAHPTSNVGNQVYLSQQKAQEDQAIQSLAQHSGLFFFYRSTCPYCQRFAPIVKGFSDRYGLSIIPITTDGITLPEFPHSQIDQGQAARFKVSMEPALFTVDPYSHQIIPVGYGLMTEDELRTRILEIAQKSPPS